MAHENSSPADPEQLPATSVRAVFEIVTGHPSAEEVAAVTVALRAKLAAGGQTPPPDRRRSAWADRSRLLRPAIRSGPDAWRRSALPG